MKLKYIQGNKTKSDRIMLLDTEGEAVQISMFHIGILINQFALNECIIIDEKKNLSREKHNWFKELVMRAMKDAEYGIDWTKLYEEYLMELSRYPYFVGVGNIKKFVKGRQDE